MYLFYYTLLHNNIGPIIVVKIQYGSMVDSPTSFYVLLQVYESLKPCLIFPINFLHRLRLLLNITCKYILWKSNTSLEFSILNLSFPVVSSMYVW